MRIYLSHEEILEISKRVLAPIEPFDIVLVNDNSIKNTLQNKYVLVSKDSDKGKLEFAVNFLEYCYSTELYEKALTARLRKVQEILNA